MKTRKWILLIVLMAFAVHAAYAQSVRWYQTTQEKNWQVSKVSLSGKAAFEQSINDVKEQGATFEAFGTTFNELDFLALQRLTPEAQDEVFRRLFAPDGDLKLTRGRVSMNANDYANGWYSCDTVAGDFELRYFNIERDKQTLLPMIHHAQKYQPNLRLWVSPWSPPAWMKINQDYCVLSSQWNKQPKEKDYLLYGNADEVDPDEMKLLGERNGVYPRRLATQDYFIQEPRYLQAYANMFCKFIDLYAAEGAPIDMVMYQNEAYSYTPYPGCPWTAEGTIRFNRDYLAPTLKAKHPEVKLYLGTFNTNRRDYVEKIVDGLVSPLTSDHTPLIGGLGFQWEARENLSAMRQRYPELKLVCSESECGNGSMDWNAAEHTFFLLSDNLGNGVTEYFNWNFILADNGRSSWGWTQNALIQVDTKTNRHRLTQEYYAFMHFSHFITEGTQLLGYNKQGRGERQRSKDIYTLLFKTKDGKHIVTAGNFSDEPKSISIPMGKKYLNVTLPAHSLNTFAE